MDIEVRCKVDRCFGIDRSQGRLWLDSARNGDLATLRSMIESKQDASEDAVWRLLHYDGQGTSFGFVGNTALHWVCANGDTVGASLLIRLGASVNCQNNGGSTPLHSAVNNGRAEIVDMLLKHGANPKVVDCCGDSAADIVHTISSRGVASGVVNRIALSIAFHGRMQQMSDTPVELWDGQTLKSTASAVGITGVIERDELVAALQSFIVEYKRASHAVTSNDDLATRFLLDAKLRYARRMQNAMEDSDDEARESAAVLKPKADAEKEKGNKLFECEEYVTAAKHYTTAIALFPGEATYYSNRAATYQLLGRYADALKDASTALHLRPEWPKPYVRATKALLGLGRHLDAESMARRGLELAPTDEVLLNLLNESSRKVSEDALCLPRHATQSARKPWFDCVLCENKTRDHAETPCCRQLVCGTCLRRRVAEKCPFCAVR